MTKKANRQGRRSSATSEALERLPEGSSARQALLATRAIERICNPASRDVSVCTGPDGVAISVVTRTKDGVQGYVLALSWAEARLLVLGRGRPITPALIRKKLGPGPATEAMVAAYKAAPKQRAMRAT